MMLIILLLNRPEEVQALISGKLALRYAGRQASQGFSSAELNSYGFFLNVIMASMHYQITGKFMFIFYFCNFRQMH